MHTHTKTYMQGGGSPALPQNLVCWRFDPLWRAGDWGEHWWR